jgi:ubiquinone/menaquinone biosynthesis C-methylase UbiE
MLAPKIGQPCRNPHGVFATALQQAGVAPGVALLDIGCGAGEALLMARAMGASVTGIDRSKAMVRFAREKVPQAAIAVGEMEHLPYADDSFDVVTGINAFQFAGSLPDALTEARRVCLPGGAVFMLVWGQREQCDLMRISIAPVLSLLAPSPATAQPPLDRARIETAMRQAGLTPTDHGEISAGLSFPDSRTAIRAVLSAGMMQRIIAAVGITRVSETLAATLPAVADVNGTITWNNQFIWVKAQRVPTESET